MILRDEVDRQLWPAMETNIGWVFEAAAKNGADLCSFADVFLRSEVFERYFTDLTVFSQSPLYVLELFEDERHPEIKPAWREESEVAYWFGYLFAAWHLDTGISGHEIADCYDMQDIWDSYDPLHTQAIEYAFETIREGYRKDMSGQCLMDDVEMLR